jgi:hypothetical protein
MAILSTDIVFRLSGGASNTLPAASLGGAKSSVPAAATIFDSVTGAESNGGDVEYRCMYVHNAHGSLTLDNAVAWVQSDTTSASTIIAVGVGSSAMNGTEQTVANEDTAPTSITFLPAVNKAGGTALGSIPPGQSRALWLRRTVTAGATVSASDPFTIRVEGDTAA